MNTDINSYNLPVTDVQSQRRNFPGYSEQVFFSLEEIQQGDSAGTTETDEITDTSKDNFETRINRKSGPKSRWNR